MDKIGVIGLGYVGLPLAIEFGKVTTTIGYDLNSQRIFQLKKNYDITREISKKSFSESKFLKFTDKKTDLLTCNIYIITVPTPKNKKLEPDLRPLKKASKLVSSLLKKNDIVIYESTVYPGVTENVCVPVLEKNSGLKYINSDKKIKNHNGFYCGYSPERINPGDKKNKFTDIIKITSGSTLETSKKIDRLYKKIIKAGTYMAPSIKVAEAAKVTENIQRDINIALVNELSIIFNKLSLDTEEVLLAAETKWNFISYRPGLVGGHCIGIDPYYLIHRSKEVGYKPKFIEAGRKTNQQMGKYVARQFSKLMKLNNITLANSKVLIMGMSYKENSSDTRDSLVYDIINDLCKLKIKVDVYDPVINYEISFDNKHAKMTHSPKKNFYDGVLVAVAHKHFRTLGVEKIRKFLKLNGILYDVKYIFPSFKTDGRL